MITRRSSTQRSWQHTCLINDANIKLAPLGALPHGEHVIQLDVTVHQVAVAQNGHKVHQRLHVWLQSTLLILCLHQMILLSIRPVRMTSHDNPILKSDKMHHDR